MNVIRDRIRIASFLVLIFVAFAGFLPSAEAQKVDKLPELLIPVTGPELASQRQSNDYFLKSTLYFAKRHRFVRVDHTVLENAKEFTVTLFPNTALAVSRGYLAIEKDSVITWQGWFEDPDAGRPMAPTTTIIEGLEIVAADSKHELTLVGVCYDYEPSTGRSFATRSGSNIEGFKRSSAESDLQKSKFYGFDSTVYVPSDKSNYRLVSLPLNPEIHVVYEIDRTKTYSVEIDDDPKNELRKSNYQDFLQSLGSNPKLEWVKRHKGEIQ